MLTLLLENIKEKYTDVLPFVNARDGNGDTPLMWAINGELIANIKSLISLGNILIYLLFLRFLSKYWTKIW